MKIYTKNEIEQVIDIPFLMQEIEVGLRLANGGKAISAPVSFMHFESPKGDVHIKSGAFLGGEIYVVKIASGFYENPVLGLPSSNGAMLLFSQKTGELITILLDEGRLTDLRTGLAGAIVTKYLAPPITAVGADDIGKQELDETVFGCADMIVVDSLSQCSSYGDLSHAKNVDLDSIIELGKWLQEPRERQPHWITVADLTGLAIEDLQVAKAIYAKLESI